MLGEASSLQLSSAERPGVLSHGKGVAQPQLLRSSVWSTINFLSLLWPAKALCVLDIPLLLEKGLAGCPAKSSLGLRLEHAQRAAGTYTSFVSFLFGPIHPSQARSSGKRRPLTVGSHFMSDED